MIQKKLWSMCYSVYMEFSNTQVYSIRWKFHDVMHFIFYMATGFPDRRLDWAYSIFDTKTARKWHIDCMESQDSPALRNKGVKVVQVKHCRAGRILFKKTEITRFHPTDVFWWKLSQSKYFVEQKPHPIGAFTESVNSDYEKNFKKKILARSAIFWRSCC